MLKPAFIKCLCCVHPCDVCMLVTGTSWCQTYAEIPFSAYNASLWCRVAIPCMYIFVSSASKRNACKDERVSPSFHSIGGGGGLP